jgi:hypothetical protein
MKMTDKSNSKMIEELTNISKASRSVSSKLLGAAAILVTIGMISFVVQFEKLNKQISEETGKIKNLRASVDTILSSNENRKSLFSTRRIAVESYFKLQQNRTSDSMQMLYADTLERFYLASNIRKEQAKLLTDSYWKKYKNDTFRIREISIADSMAAKILISGDQCRDGAHCVNEIIEMRFNNSGKIEYIRAFTPSNND